jgi:microsomal dipeptidase-like Zn-dependent dipeptidase
MNDSPAGAGSPFSGLTDIHAHPAMNSFLWDRDLRRHYWTGHVFNPLASLTDFRMLEQGGVKVLWSSLHIPESDYFRCWLLRFVAHLTSGGRKLLKLSAWECLLEMMAEMERQVARAGDRFEVARSNADLDRVLAAGRTAIVHTVEGGHVLGAGLEADDAAGREARLDELAERGVASLTLAHLFPNDLAGHAEAIPEMLHRLPTCELDSGVDPDRGLTPMGRAVVERMVDLRIIPDVTHCTPVARREIYELVAHSTATRANARERRLRRRVCGHLDQTSSLPPPNRVGYPSGNELRWPWVLKTCASRCDDRNLRWRGARRRGSDSRECRRRGVWTQ